MVSTKCIFIALRSSPGLPPGPSHCPGQDYFEQSSAVGGQQFFFQSADGQHFAAQRDLAGHGDIAAHRNLAQSAGNRGGDGDAGRRTVLRNGAFRHVHVNVESAVEVARQTQRCARERTYDMAACADSCMTSPSLPVSVSLPLPSTTVASVLRMRAADFGPGQAGHQANFALFMGQGVAELDHAQEVVDVVLQRWRRCSLRLLSRPYAQPCGKRCRSRAPGCERRLPACRSGSAL